MPQIWEVLLNGNIRGHLYTLTKAKHVLVDATRYYVSPLIPDRIRIGLLLMKVNDLPIRMWQREVKMSHR